MFATGILRNTVSATVLAAMLSCLALPAPLFAASADAPTLPGPGEVSLDPTADPATTPDDDNEVARTAVRWTMIAGTPVVLVILGAKMWDWGTTHHFRAGSDGWFEVTNSSGGADKLAHVYACYAVTRLMRKVFQYTERDDDAALLYGILMGAIVGVGIEIGDGFSQSYGFSFTDIIADVAGIGLGALLDKIPELDGALKLTYWWWPSKGYVRKFPESWTDTFIDYTGQQFFLSLKLSGLPYLRDTPFKYFQLDSGFYTRGYKVYDRMDEKQAVFLGVSVNFGAVLADLIGVDENDHGSTGVFRYVHMPVGFYPDSLEWSRKGQPYVKPE